MCASPPPVDMRWDATRGHCGLPSHFEQPNAQIVAHVRAVAQATGGSLTLTNDPQLACRGASVIATDTWVSMGDEAQQAKRLADFAGFQVTEKMGSVAQRNWRFIHWYARAPVRVGARVDVPAVCRARSTRWTTMSFTGRALWCLTRRRIACGRSCPCAWRCCEASCKALRLLMSAHSRAQLRHLIQHSLTRSAARTAALLHTGAKVPHGTHVTLKQRMQLLQL